MSLSSDLPDCGGSLFLTHPNKAHAAPLPDPRKGEKVGVGRS